MNSPSKSTSILPAGGRRAWLAAALVGALGAGFASRVTAGSESRVLPPFAATEQATAASGPTETAVLAGGCFWGVQGVFQHVKGVLNAVSGYAGGDKDTAVYGKVGSGRTGHAEAVQVTFDPRQISYARLLQIYFSVAHDPTQLNRQGPDRGTQYRSTIFPLDAGQAGIAKAYIEQLTGARAFDAPIATTIEPGRAFYPAEDDHQDFLARNPTHRYVVVNDLPKIHALEQLFPADYRAAPALVSAARKTAG